MVGLNLSLSVMVIPYVGELLTICLHAENILFSLCVCESERERERDLRYFSDSVITYFLLILVKIISINRIFSDTGL